MTEAKKQKTFPKHKVGAALGGLYCGMTTYQATASLGYAALSALAGGLGALVGSVLIATVAATIGTFAVALVVFKKDHKENKDKTNNMTEKELNAYAERLSDRSIRYTGAFALAGAIAGAFLGANMVANKLTQGLDNTATNTASHEYTTEVPKALQSKAGYTLSAPKVA